MWSRLRTAPLYALVATAIIAAAVLLRLADPDAIARLRLSAFDTFQQLAPRAPDPSFPVKVVAVDEASLEAFGQWPWPRNVLADLIDKLNAAGAKAIALDLVLPEADRLSPETFAEAYAGDPQFAAIASGVSRLTTLDARLGSALHAAPSVLAFAGDNTASGQPGKVRASFAAAGDPPLAFVPTFAGSVGNLGVLDSEAHGLGAANWLPERDQIVRRVPLLIGVGETLYPSLVLEALRVANGQSTVFIKSSGGSGVSALGQRTGIELVRVGATVIPTTARGEVWMRFSPSDVRRTISARQVLSQDFDAGEVAGRIVFIGATAVGLLDLRATPLAAAVPGVEMHAQALEQILTGDHALRPAYALGLELSFLVLAAGIVAWLIGRAGPVAAAVLAVAAIGGIAYAAYGSYLALGLLFDPVYPSIALALVYAGGSLTRFVQAEQERRQVRDAFKNYLAPDLVAELVADPAKLKLGGEMREVTLLFADVRNFSALAEGRDAEALVTFVNGLFTPLSAAILEERGTIDKYMGDAVMAFWNAPLAEPAHARLACRAALGMLRSLDRLNEELRRKAADDGRAYEPIRIGIGLNTGDCCVGNVGSPGRFDYSVLGDPVNVASRLEQLTKTYGVAIIAGTGTARAAAGMAFLEIDTVTPRGKSERHAIHALLGSEDLTRNPQFQALVPQHLTLLRALEAGDNARAEEALSACQRIGLAHYQPLAGYYASRLGH